MSAINLYDLANIEVVSARAQEAIKKQAVLLNAKLKARQNGEVHIKNINNWSMWLTGANDTNQPDELRIRLVTLLVDIAQLNPVATPAIYGFVQPVASTEISSVPFSQITGSPESNMALNAKFNTYLPLSAGTTKPLTGALYFASDELGVDVINEGDTLNIGASAGIVQVGLDAEVRVGNITQGAWLATNISVAKGGLGSLDFTSGADGQAVVKSGSGYAFYTIPAIPSLTGYIKADGTVPMTADLRFPISKGIDTAAAGTLYIGQNNATAVQIFQNLSVTNVVSGNWQANPVDLEFGGTGAVLAPPSNPSFFIYNSGSAFAEIGANLRIDSGTVTLSEILTGVKYEGSVIETPYGGTGLSTVGAEGEVLTVVSGAPAWAAFSALTNPMTTAGDIIYGGVAGAPTRLAANGTATNKFLRSVSSGDPSWQTLVAGDIPNIAQSQVTGLTTALANKLSTVLTDGYMLVGNAANAAVAVLMDGDATMDNAGIVTITDEAVTFAKMQNITATTLVGRWSAGDGPMQEVSIGSGLSLSISGVLSATGGGGTPGGSDTQLQYNNAGSFGGITGATTNGTFVTLTTPVLGVASATSINKVAITAPATGSTLTIADGKTLTASNTLTFTGTDGSSVAFGAGGTVAYVGLANTWTSGIKQTFAPSATNAGINVGTLAGQPSSPANGDLVYNSSATALQAYINGTWVSLGAGGGGGVTTVGAFSGSSQTNGASISSTTITFGPADGTNPGMVTTGPQTLAGAKTFTQGAVFSLAGASGNAIDLTGTGSKTNAAIRLSGGAPRWIDFGSTGAAAPAIGAGSRSDGTKIVLANTQGALTSDFAFGMTSTTMWASVANNTASYGFEWYGGATLRMTLLGSGVLTLTAAIVGAASQDVFNTVSTTVNAFGASTALTIGATTGTATIRNATLNANDDFKLPTVGTGIYVKEGTNATMGSATLVGGTVVVSTTKVTANSRIFLTNNVNGGTLGSLSVSARTAGTSFTISSTNVLDTSTVAWVIIEPA